MQQLDEDKGTPAGSPLLSPAYTIIGGRLSDLTRMPSFFMEISERCKHCHGKVATSPKALASGETGLAITHFSCGASRNETDGRTGVEADVLKWNQEDVHAWLSENGLQKYEMSFREHAIYCGRSLVSLTEEHLKEMGVIIGHRIKLMQGIEQLRRGALISSHKSEDIASLYAKLNSLKLERMLQLYPHRIILIRHGESEGNIDNSLYKNKPDRNMMLTPLGIQQANGAGSELKRLIEEESVTFYVSPFLRSRQTFEQIRQCFNDEQVLHMREDPRIREQEWGNFQDPLKMKEVIEERRKVGSFYYRFPTGESGADVYDRVSTFLETMYRDMEKGGCGENAIIVSHGLFCRLFLMRYFHWKVEKFHKLWNFKNCQYAVMEQRGLFYQLISELKSDH